VVEGEEHEPRDTENYIGVEGVEEVVAASSRVS